MHCALWAKYLFQALFTNIGTDNILSDYERFKGMEAETLFKELFGD